MMILRRLVLVAPLLAGSVAAAEFKGWISDSQCGAGNASSEAGNRECAKVCIKNGAKPVFVTEKGGNVYHIAGKADVTKHLDYKVKVSGELKGDTLTIQSIAKAD
jgi:hypothetical protein